ncbi:hypothetical protein LguiB_027154 [Lonicera macranthoides]
MSSRVKKGKSTRSRAFGEHKENFATQLGYFAWQGTLFPSTLPSWREVDEGHLKSIEKESLPITVLLLKGEDKVTLLEEENKKGIVKVFVNKDDFEKIELTKSVYKNLCSNLNKVLKGDKSSSKMLERMSNLIILCSASGVTVEANEALAQLKKDG